MAGKKSDPKPPSDMGMGGIIGLAVLIIIVLVFAGLATGCINIRL